MSLTDLRKLEESRVSVRTGVSFHKSGLLKQRELERKQVIIADIACVASVSAQVPQESWDESKRKRFPLFPCPALPSSSSSLLRVNFRVKTRTQALATQVTVNKENH